MTLQMFYIYCTFSTLCISILNRTSKLMGNRQIDFLSLINFKPIVIPSSVRDKTDFVVISPIYNVCESVFLRIINWNLSGFAFIEFYTNIYVLRILYKVSELLRAICFSKSTQNFIEKRFKIIWGLLVYHFFINFW